MKPVSATQALRYLFFRKIWGRGLSAYALTEENEFLLCELSSRVAGTLKAKSYQEEAKKLQNVPQKWRYFVPLEYYAMQVCNGGHHQFFMNSEGAFNSLVLEGLSYFDFSDFQTLFQRAVQAYQPEVYEENRPETWEEFTKGYGDSLLDEIDTGYYAIEPSLDESLESHIRANLASYQT